MTLLPNPCPFQTDKGRCGQPVVVFDADHTTVLCADGHTSSIDHLPPAEPGPASTPLVLRLPRRKTDIPVRDIVLGALVTAELVRLVL